MSSGNKLFAKAELMSSVTVTDNSSAHILTNLGEHYQNLKPYFHLVY